MRPQVQLQDNRNIKTNDSPQRSKVNLHPDASIIGASGLMIDFRKGVTSSGDSLADIPSEMSGLLYPEGDLKKNKSIPSIETI